TDEERARFLAGLTDLNRRASAHGGVSFAEVPPQEQAQILKTLEAESLAMLLLNAQAKPFFSLLKELTLLCYYTSQIGASQELRYVHVAGSYAADIPFDQVGRAYS